ncbi:MAG: ribonuclease J [Rickettsiales bacterium]
MLTNQNINICNVNANLFSIDIHDNNTNTESLEVNNSLSNNSTDTNNDIHLDDNLNIKSISTDKFKNNNTDNILEKNNLNTSIKRKNSAANIVYLNLNDGKIEIDNFLEEKLKNGISFFALGGVNQIGLNMNMYHYKGTWIIVDCGSGFTNKPGIDILVPSTEFIIRNNIKISAMFITHLHEDHIGGLIYFFRTTGSNCIVYTTKLTYHFLKIKLEKAQLEHKIQVEFIEGLDSNNTSQDNGPKNFISVDNFIVKPVELTHSTPGMNAYLISAKDAPINIFHTGDWKFDAKPIIGEPANEFLLKKIGENGVNAIICDSTNVFNPNATSYEGDLAINLKKIIARATGTVFVTTFGSNYGRVISIQKAAISAGKKVLILGKSMENIIKAAQRAGIHNEIILREHTAAQNSTDAIIASNIISPDNTSEIQKCINENKLLVIATGCQGEYLAAMSKIAREEMVIGTGFKIKLRKNDTVIFSSKRIPGNEDKLEKLYNLIYQFEAKIITENDHFVHASGHCSQPEMLKMYQLMTKNDKSNFNSYIIPVHGSLINTHKHCDLIEEWNKTKQLSNVKSLRIRDGSVVNIGIHESKVIDRVRTESICVNGNQYIAEDSALMKTREQMQNGIVIVSIYLYRDRVSNFKLACPGYLDAEDSKILIEEIENKIEKILLRINNLRHIKSREIIEKDIKFIIESISYNVIRAHGKIPHIEFVYINASEKIGLDNHLNNEDKISNGNYLNNEDKIYNGNSSKDIKNQDKKYFNNQNKEYNNNIIKDNTKSVDFTFDQFGTKIIKNIENLTNIKQQDPAIGGIIGGNLKNNNYKSSFNNHRNFDKSKNFTKSNDRNFISKFNDKNINNKFDNEKKYNKDA